MGRGKVEEAKSLNFEGHTSPMFSFLAIILDGLGVGLTRYYISVPRKVPIIDLKVLVATLFPLFVVTHQILLPVEIVLRAASSCTMRTSRDSFCA